MSYDNIDGTGYNDSNRAFLQAFMARSSMTFNEARPILAAIFSAQGIQHKAFPFQILMLPTSLLIRKRGYEIKKLQKTIPFLQTMSPRKTSNRTSGPPIPRSLPLISRSEVPFAKRSMGVATETRTGSDKDPNVSLRSLTLPATR